MTTILGRNPYEVLFRDFFNNNSFFDELTQCKYPYPVDIYETKDGLNIDIAAVGLSSDDIDISIESDVLRITYNKEQETERSEDTKYIHKGIARRSYNLGWKIGAQFELSILEAVLDKGLLQISIPYSEQAAPQKVTIKNK